MLIPKGKSKYGVVTLMRKTGEHIHEKPYSDDKYETSFYVRMVWPRLRKYQATGEFPKRAQIAWY